MRYFASAIFFFHFIFQSLFAQNTVIPKQFIVDPPTFRSLAFRWIVEGDDNINASIQVQYRKKDTNDWKFALPLMRIDGDIVNRDFDFFKTGNLFAGSILLLEPGTNYEVELTLADPDGYLENKSIIVSTRSPEDSYKPQKIFHLYPEGYSEEKAKPHYSNLNNMLSQLTPGTMVIAHHGTYYGTYEFKISGSEVNPIVIKGTPEGEAIFDGQGSDGKIFDVQDKSYVRFENLVMRNAHTAIKGNNADGIQVKNCSIFDVHYGIVSMTKTHDWVIANNRIKGRVDDWSNRKRVKDIYGTCTGIIIDGIGHVVCYNTVSDFWDCVTISNLEEPEPWYEPHNMCIDFYNNDLYNAADDLIETDFSYYNVRVWNNRLLNSETGISTQPVYGGPVYIFRNQIYNARTPLKLHNWPSGLQVYNNTIISSERAFWSDPIWQNARIMNNLFLGASSYSIATGSPDPRTILDYNGYYRVPGQEKMIKWSTDNRKTWARLENLGQFTAQFGHETHGIMIDYAIFNRAQPPDDSHTFFDYDIDLILKENSVAIDAGLYIPNISDGYTGLAPDLGFNEKGNTVPHFGQYENFNY